MQKDNIFLKNLTKRTNFSVCSLKIGENNFLICEEEFCECKLISIFLLDEERLLESFFASELVVEDSGFYADRIHFDSLGHADKVGYFLENGKVVREVSCFSTEKNTKKHPLLIPVYLFESVKAEHLNEARGYLCDDLQKVADEFFLEYFENYSHLIYEKEKYFLICDNVKREIVFQINKGTINNFEVIE